MNKLKKEYFNIFLISKRKVKNNEFKTMTTDFIWKQILLKKIFIFEWISVYF